MSSRMTITVCVECVECEALACKLLGFESRSWGLGVGASEMHRLVAALPHYSANILGNTGLRLMTDLFDAALPHHPTNNLGDRGP